MFLFIKIETEPKDGVIKNFNKHINFKGTDKRICYNPKNNKYYKSYITNISWILIDYEYDNYDDIIKEINNYDRKFVNNKELKKYNVKNSIKLSTIINKKLKKDIKKASFIISENTITNICIFMNELNNLNYKLYDHVENLIDEEKIICINDIKKYTNKKIKFNNNLENIIKTYYEINKKHNILEIKDKIYDEINKSIIYENICVKIKEYMDKDIIENNIENIIQMYKHKIKNNILELNDKNYEDIQNIYSEIDNTNNKIIFDIETNGLFNKSLQILQIAYFISNNDNKII